MLWSIAVPLALGVAIATPVEVEECVAEVLKTVLIVLDSRVLVTISRVEELETELEGVDSETEEEMVAMATALEDSAVEDAAVEGATEDPEVLVGDEVVTVAEAEADEADSVEATVVEVASPVVDADTSVETVETAAELSLDATAEEDKVDSVSMLKPEDSVIVRTGLLVEEVTAIEVVAMELVVVVVEEEAMLETRDLAMQPI